MELLQCNKKKKNERKVKINLLREEMYVNMSNLLIDDVDNSNFYNYTIFDES